MGSTSNLIRSEFPDIEEDSLAKDSFKERQPRPHPPKKKKTKTPPFTIINPQSALTFRSSQPSASFLSVFCLT